MTHFNQPEFSKLVGALCNTDASIIPELPDETLASNSPELITLLKLTTPKLLQDFQGEILDLGRVASGQDGKYPETADFVQARITSLAVSLASGEYGEEMRRILSDQGYANVGELSVSYAANEIATSLIILTGFRSWQFDTQT